MKNFIAIGLMQLLLIISGCGVSAPRLEDNITDKGPDGSPGQTEEFNYQTTKPLEVVLKTQMKGCHFDIYDDKNKLLASVTKNQLEPLTIKISTPSITKGIYIKTDYIGLPGEVYAPIENLKVELDYDKRDHVHVENQAFALFKTTALYQAIGNFPAYAILGTWNYKGVPDYLVERKVIGNDIIQKINQALPEKKPVPDFHPQYLMENLDTGLNLIKEADVFVTFVHEGAGYRNSLGYYTFQTADGPPDEVLTEDITLIFPNVSYFYGGGGLYSGDTVNLGRFPAGTSIGWVLMSNAYNRSKRGVAGGINKFYSENSLNPDPDPHKQHFVQLDLDGFIALGIEDLKRPWGDNDFNDAVFTVESNPVEAIDTSGLVTDTDEYYTEPEEDPELELQEPPLFDVAGYQFFPGKDEFGTLAFEDLWPHKGDYDFNDLVIDYNVVETLDANNKIVQLQITLKIVGILASMKNGFGLQLGIPPELVASVTGGQYTKGYAVLAGNGTEKRQQKAVIIAFEDATEHYNSSSPDDSELLILSVNFTRGLDRTELGFAPYNPFIMSNGERGREVHLPGYQPTNLVHADYFGSADDDSIIGTNFMYKTLNDLPWAIHLPEKFAYPYDSIKIYDAFPLFEDWVNSNGFSHSDWYTDKPGYRENELIMRK
ncbi:MAG: LruC domain-containing protein [Bdellovibrionales bacterium]|nr:LruC domain-containing protein [Bdellovibrionales bacterium]NQZ17705.1 LruC domain-containing protein [Bdellovibrionales bacterium]